jgi:zinc transporter ZupT
MQIGFQIGLFLLAVLIGGGLVDVLKKSTSLKLLLSFSGGFLLTIIFSHILPEAYHAYEDTGYFILIGFVLQLILEYFSKGAEHGHTHIHKNELNVAFPVAIFISLSLHSFIEAIPINHGIHPAHVGHSHSDNLFWGVFMHKIPVAIALKTIFDASGLSAVKSWLFLIIFGCTAPLGLMFGAFITANFDFSLTWLLAIAIGMFFHVSTTIIFESNEGHKLNLFKLLAILLGFGVGILFA